MNYYVVDRGDEASLRLAEHFHKLASKHGMILDEGKPDIVLSIGGDGTMLHAFHKFIKQIDHIAFVGIHTGHLGFFADWKPDEIEHLMALIIQPAPASKLKIVQYPLLDVLITTETGTESYLALNEFTLKGVEKMLVAQLNINDEMFEMFRGDGICISTPSGSTAYNKSLGGALLHPAIEAIQIAEIASINNRVYRTLGSPMILPKHHHCDIYPKGHHQFVLSVDHNLSLRNDVVSVRTMVSTQKVRFARYRPFPFWDRVREAFIGFEEK